jgi:hypothetical protein
LILFGEDLQCGKHGFSVRDGGFRFDVHGGEGHPPHPQACDPLLIEDPVNVMNNVARSCFNVAAVQRAFLEASDHLKRRILRHHSTRSDMKLRTDDPSKVEMNGKETIHKSSHDSLFLVVDDPHDQQHSSHSRTDSHDSITNEIISTHDDDSDSLVLKDVKRLQNRKSKSFSCINKITPLLQKYEMMSPSYAASGHASHGSWSQSRDRISPSKKVLSETVPPKSSFLPLIHDVFNVNITEDYGF